MHMNILKRSMVNKEKRINSRLSFVKLIGVPNK